MDWTFVKAEKRLKEPPLNTSREAVKLREAAEAFGDHAVPMWGGDPDDVAGQRLNIALLKSALSYAKAVERAEKKRKKRK